MSYVDQNPINPNTRPVDLLFTGNARLTALASGTCVMDSDAWNHSCKGNGTAGEFKDALSRKEYEITAMCQLCQDDTFASMQEDPEEDEYTEEEIEEEEPDPDVL